jgi:outer membrane protein W
MRRLSVLACLVLTVSTVTLSAQPSGSVRLSGFWVNPSDTAQFEFQPGSDRSYGAGVEYFLKSNLSWQLAASSEQTVATWFTPAGLPSTKFERIYPIDGTARYYLGSSSFKPFLGAGVRYIRVVGQNNWRPELAGGLTFAITPHLGIDLEARSLFNRRKPEIVQPLGAIRARDGAFDEGRSRRLSVGLGWRF